MVRVDYFKNSGEFQSFKAGTHIFEEGDADNGLMYAVKEGEVEIVHNGDVLEIVTPGNFFGEMALIDHSVRSAGAITKTDCKIVIIDKHKFLFLVQETPTFAVQVMHTMAERLRRMTNK